MDLSTGRFCIHMGRSPGTDAPQIVKSNLLCYGASCRSLELVQDFMATMTTVNLSQKIYHSLNHTMWDLFWIRCLQLSREVVFILFYFIFGGRVHPNKV